MKVRVISAADKQLLVCWLLRQAQIKETFLGKWVSSKVNTQDVVQNFDRKISGDSEELIYAVLLNEQGKILIIASLFM
jgi:hypothetical protein